MPHEHIQKQDLHETVEEEEDLNEDVENRQVVAMGSSAADTERSGYNMLQAEGACWVVVLVALKVPVMGGWKD